MSPASPKTKTGKLKPGDRVSHLDLGDGVVSGPEQAGFTPVFFQGHGERRVPAISLSEAADQFDRIFSALAPASADRLTKVWLAVEAEELPLMESAAVLTSAKVDLLPHQVVLVHRVANTNPRRFLIADEVGLGKTIETALVLRELASRGELQRALMIVPAGLVENWRHELNDVFNLDFEVFGAEGDVTDRKSNAFAKHNRLIASVDTLKRRERVQKLLAAPPWDLVVFDEAHHLSVYKNGGKVTKTENFKLAEALRNHCQGLLLLSATPHQGDHFRFWMLVKLLAPGLFEDVEDMIKNRHRLNAVVIRRSKADSCAPDGSPLFARRVVHTEGFPLSDKEKVFYQELMSYLKDGYDLAAKQGNKGRALGFVMTVFQKIAASSFAAIRSTLKRRLLMLTLKEAVERDERLDVDGRDRVLADARAVIHDIHSLPFDAVGRAQVERILTDAKIQLLKKRKEAEDSVSVDPFFASESSAALGEESAAMLVTAALPEERTRIKGLLEMFPSGAETKSVALSNALRQIWARNSDEKVVVFATYLGSVDAIQRHLGQDFPEKGVDVLKGGDHGAKTAAQKRFKRKDGPHVLVCTAAGREGINLQFARVLFNYDLPWNPMDLEQRIGRIHRYGQQSTSQVYNLVAQDTIEGQIFLLLEEKLGDIAQALGKVDEYGQIAEDFRGQVLGQLSSQLGYDRLYQEAISDPTLIRTRQELEVALYNAGKAREVVFELFQDLDRFNLGDYKKHEDQGRGMRRLVDFLSRAEKLSGRDLRQKEDGLWELAADGMIVRVFTTVRERALQDEKIDLIGLEHPLIREKLERSAMLDASLRGMAGRLNGQAERGLLLIWKILASGSNGRGSLKIVRIGLTQQCERAPWLERLGDKLLGLSPVEEKQSIEFWTEIGKRNKSKIQDILHRELAHTGLISDGVDYSASLLAAVAVEA